VGVYKKKRRKKAKQRKKRPAGRNRRDQGGEVPIGSRPGKGTRTLPMLSPRRKGKKETLLEKWTRKQVRGGKKRRGGQTWGNLGTNSKGEARQRGGWGGGGKIQQAPHKTRIPSGGETKRRERTNGAKRKNKRQKTGVGLTRIKASHGTKQRVLQHERKENDQKCSRRKTHKGRPRNRRSEGKL